MGHGHWKALRGFTVKAQRVSGAESERRKSSSWAWKLSTRLQLRPALKPLISCFRAAKFSGSCPNFQGRVTTSAGQGAGIQPTHRKDRTIVSL